jgi:hypothetical protein
MTHIDLTAVEDDAKHLVNHLEQVLENVVNTYASYNMPLPTRQYWTLGQTVVDCEQLVVCLLQMYIGSPGDEATEPRRCNDPRTATITVAVSRQIPVVGPSGKAPTPTRIEEGMTPAAYDAWILMEAVRTFDTWEGSGFGLGVIATLETPPPEGGFQTVVLTMTSAVP